MRGLGRVFAHAAVRKLAGIVVLALLAWAGIGRAEAGCTSTGYAGSYFCATPAEAQAAAQANLATFTCAGITNKRVASITFGWSAHGHPSHPGYQAKAQNPSTWVCGTPSMEYNGTVYMYDTPTCPNGGTFNVETAQCEPACSTTDAPLGKSSLLVPPGTEENPWINQPAGACVGGCAYSGALENSKKVIIDGQQYVTYTSMEPVGQKCTVGGAGGFSPPVTPPPDSDGDGSSDGNDPKPNNPGTGGPGEPGPDGQPPPDGNGNGTGQGSGNGNQSTGGGNCQTPPSSNGDAIAAQIAYQTWATRCAIEGLKGKNGSVNVSISGTGAGGTGDGDSNGDGSGNAVPGFGEGELYERTDKTVESVYADFKAEMMGTEFGQAFTGFIGSCQGGGSCPTASWEASTWGISVSLAELCAGALGSLLEFAGWVFLAGMAWFGYRVALL